jgi:hypothetical protein
LTKHFRGDRLTMNKRLLTLGSRVEDRVRLAAHGANQVGTAFFKALSSRPSEILTGRSLSVPRRLASLSCENF